MPDGVIATPLSGGSVLVTGGGGWLAKVAADGAGGCCSGMICTEGLTGEARFDGAAGGASREASEGIKVVEGAGLRGTATEGAGAPGTAAMADLAPPAEDCPTPCQRAQPTPATVEAASTHSTPWAR
jgi:hypothetical protein